MKINKADFYISEIIRKEKLIRDEKEKYKIKKILKKLKMKIKKIKKIFFKKKIMNNKKD